MLNGPMPLRRKLSLLVAGTFALFVAALAILRVQELRAQETLHDALRRAEARQLGRWLEIFDRPLQEFLLDLAPWPETQDFLARPDPDWAHRHLAAALADRQFEAVWVVRADGHLAYAGQRDPAIAAPDLPAAADLAELTRHASRAQFFAADAAGTLWQYQLAPVPDATGAAAGWLAVARRWNDARLEQLAALADCTVRLAAPSPDAATAPGEWRRTLADVNGRTVREIIFTPRTAVPATGSVFTWPLVLLCAAFGSLLLVAVWLAVSRWVLRPLGLIAGSLREAAPERVGPLLRGRDEFAPVAGLVVQAFAHRAALEREIAERRRTEEALRLSEENLRHSVELRARLARDLHDHVIQSIYAAGLGLEAVRAEMSDNPFGAEGRVRHCMDNLNETIRTVRRYINDLEPDAPGQRQQFAEAVRALTEMMGRLWPVEFVLELEDGAAPLTNLVEIHALQIVRESLSNAVRHGRATRITISLRKDAGATLLCVRDNGCGFDPLERLGTGRGLVNLTTRAREMGATLHIDSRPGAGTSVTVRLGGTEGSAP
jgi:signal transduction histidine kinase